MRVFTYYEPIRGHGDAKPLINLWSESWKERGWRTCVINEADAFIDKRYPKYREIVDSFPTVNQRAYERACYLRWLAMTRMEDSLAVLSDYDVINRSFAPGDAEALIGPHDIVMLEPTRVPCAVLATPKGFEIVCDMIENYQVSPTDLEHGSRHVSDMTILRKTNIPTTNTCVEHLNSGSSKRDDPGDGWKTAPLIHYSSFSFMKQKIYGTHPKDWLIKNALKNLDK